MAFREFTFPEVFDRLNLKLSQADLFPESLPPFAVTPEFLARLQRDAQLALEINTEKARSEFIIAPLLAEVWRAAPRRGRWRCSRGSSSRSIKPAS